MIFEKIKRFFNAVKMSNKDWIKYLESNEDYVEGMRVNPGEMPLVREIPLRLVKPHSNVLSAGCGAGREVKFLVRELNCKVTAIDISEKMVEWSKKQEKNAEYIVGDIAKFKSKKKFDYVVCLFNTINQLLNLEERKKFIRACEFNLNEGGQLIICSTNMFSSWQSLIFSIFQKERKPCYHPKQIDKWFEGTKFIIEKVKLNDEMLIKATRR